MAAAAWEPFAEVLRATREAMGHPSARSFYMKAGGRRFFGATYRQYLNVESAISGPGPQLVEKVALALRLSTDRDRARAFFSAYLRSLVGSESLLDVIMASMTQTPPAEGAALRGALARQSAGREAHLTREQADLIESSLESYWSWFLVIAATGPRTPEQVAGAVGLKTPAVKSALKALSKAGLVVEGKDGRYKAAHSSKVLRFPRDAHFDLRRKMTYEHAAKAGQGREKVLFHYFTLMRASEKELLAYAPHLFEAVDGSQICSTNETATDTGVTLVETTARKLFPY